MELFVLELHDVIQQDYNHYKPYYTEGYDHDVVATEITHYCKHRNGYSRKDGTAVTEIHLKNGRNFLVYETLEEVREKLAAIRELL